MAQFLFKIYLFLFGIKSVLASPLLTSASASADLADVSESINMPHKELPAAKFTWLASRDGTEHPTEITDITAAQELPNSYNNKHTKRAANYAKGTCSFHLWESQICGSSVKEERYARLVLKDNSGATIAEADNNANGGKGPRIDQKWLEVKGQLPHYLLIKAADKENHAQFAYGPYEWHSGTEEREVEAGHPHCNQGAWDPREEFWHCSGKRTKRVRQMDCVFPC